MLNFVIKMSSLMLVICLSQIALTPTMALQVTPDSVCASVCLDNSTSDSSDPNASNTYGSDIVCKDDDYVGNQVGQKFQQCVNCLQNSMATKSGENDQAWFLYNLRFALNACLFVAFNATDPISTPCSTNTACGPLQDALESGMQTPSTMSQYGYCSVEQNQFQGTYLGNCESCLRENDQQLSYLSNFLIALDAGCIQKPTAGTLIGLNSTVFSASQVEIVSPPTSPVSSSTSHKNLSEGAIIGIAVACGITALFLLAILFICTRRRRNVRRLKSLISPLDERFGASNITAPNRGAFASPLSSPPLVKLESIPSKHKSKPRNFSFVPHNEKSSEPGHTPLYPMGQPSPYESSMRSERNSFPAHPAYIPTQYTASSKSTTTSPMPYIPPGSASSSPNPPPTYKSSQVSPSIISQRSPPAPPSIRSRHSGSGPGISPNLLNRNASVSRTAHRDLSGRRILEGGGISGPLVDTGKRFDEGIGGTTMVSRDEREETLEEGRKSESSEELWPGSY